MRGEDYDAMVRAHDDAPPSRSEMNLTGKPTTHSPLQWMRWHAQQADDALTKMRESDGPVHASLSNAICAEAQVHATLAVAWATIAAAGRS